MLSSSVSQAALAKGVAQENGAIQENSYAEQQGYFSGMAGAAKAAGQSSTIGGAIQAIGAAGNIAEAVTGTSSLSGAATSIGQDLGIVGATAAATTAAVSAAVPVAAADIGASLAAAAIPEAATTAASAVAASAAADAGATAVAAAGGTDILATIGTTLLAIVGWVICTEFMRQGRLPRRWWITGARIFSAYPEPVRQGYFLWAIPSVRHIRCRPYSLYSRFLCAIFNWRAENIAARAGVPGARRLLRGALVTVVLWPVCYVLGLIVMATKGELDWKALYA